MYAETETIAIPAPDTDPDMQIGFVLGFAIQDVLAADFKVSLAEEIQ